MNRADFAELLTRMAQRAVPPLSGRHVYLWHGEVADLRALLRASPVLDLDLYSLATRLPKTPFALDEARRLLQASITTSLQENVASATDHQIILVRGASLLQRYRVPLDAFFQISTETRLVVFAVSPAESGYRPPRPVPAYVDLEPDATFEYLRTKLGENALIGETVP